LKFLLNQTISTVAQQCWLVKLLGYDYEIEYKQGKENFVEAPQTLMAISHPIHHWLELFKMKFTRIQSCNLQALVVRIQAGEAVGQWKFQGGLISLRSEYICLALLVIPPIITEIHGSTHEGFFKNNEKVESSVLLA